MSDQRFQIGEVSVATVDIYGFLHGLVFERDLDDELVVDVDATVIAYDLGEVRGCRVMCTTQITTELLGDLVDQLFVGLVAVLGRTRYQPAVPDADLLITQLLDGGRTVAEPEHLSLRIIAHELGGRAWRTTVQQVVAGHAPHDSISAGASTVTFEIAVSKDIFNEGTVLGIGGGQTFDIESKGHHKLL
ncbi:hypothetical protein D3C78_879110 [compost metagenome]